MAEQDVSNEVLRPTGLTPATEEAPPPEPEESTAAPPYEGEARPEDYPADSETTDEAPAVHAEVKKPSRGVQKALDRLREERAQADRATELERTRANLAEANLRQIAWEQQRMAAARQQVEADPEPKMEKYSDWGKYNADLAKWAGRQEAKQYVQREFVNLAQGIAQHQWATQAQAEQYQVDARLAQASQKGAEKLPDWNDVVVTSDLPVTEPLKYAIAQADDPAMAMHYLATHPNEHMRLVNLPPFQLALVAGKMFAGTNPNISRAPPPGRPVGARTSGPTGYRDDFTPAQHKAWLAKQAR